MSEEDYNDWFEFDYQDSEGNKHEKIAACAYDSENIQLFFDHHLGKSDDQDFEKGDLVLRMWANIPAVQYAGNFHPEQDVELMKLAQANSLKKLIESLGKIKEEAEEALKKL